jgi:hypothetical protein
MGTANSIIFAWSLLLRRLAPGGPQGRSRATPIGH